MVTHMYVWSPYVFMSYMTLKIPHTLYGIGIIWSPQHVHMVPPHVLYDSYVPPYLIWNRYHMAPHVSMVPPHVRSDGPPLLYMEQVSYGSPNMYDMIFFRTASKEVRCVS